jgi:CBS-domain-containing membrane protein
MTIYIVCQEAIRVEPDISCPEAMGILRRKKIRRLPVVEHGRLIGIMVEDDLLSNQPSPATTISIHEMYALLERLRVRQIISRPVITVEGICRTSRPCSVDAILHTGIAHAILVLRVVQAATRGPFRSP